jgi:hypothetical protein
VSFLSDDEEEAAAKQAKQQQQQQSRRSTRRTDSTKSLMSSLDGSDVDIDYSVEQPGGADAAAAVTAVRPGRQPTAGQQQQRPQTLGKHAAYAAVSGNKAVAPGAGGAAARSAVDVFYSHVGGTPSYQ